MTHISLTWPPMPTTFHEHTFTAHPQVYLILPDHKDGVHCVYSWSATVKTVCPRSFGPFILLILYDYCHKHRWFCFDDYYPYALMILFWWATVHMHWWLCFNELLSMCISYFILMSCCPYALMSTVHFISGCVSLYNALPRLNWWANMGLLL